MPKMSSTDAKIYATRYLIHSLHNPSPEIPLVALGNPQKEALRYIADISVKATSPAVPLRVPVRGEYQEKLQQVNHEETKLKVHPIKSDHSPIHNL